MENKGIVVEINDMFSKLTGFHSEELLNKGISVVWNLLARGNTKIYDLNTEVEVVIFTKSLDVRLVNIQKVQNVLTCETIYEFIEKPNSRLETKLIFFEKLMSDEKIGIGIHTAKDFTLLKSNQAYLKFFPEPFSTKEVCYGKNLKDLLPGFQESLAENVWRNIVNSNQSYYMTEKQGLLPDNDRYWDYTITPVCESGEVKYIIAMIEDVTERVLSREHIRIKNEQLEAIFNSVEDIIGIIDKHENYIAGNKYSKKLFDFLKGNQNLTKKCFRVCDLAGKEFDSGELNFNLVLSGKELKKIKITIELNDGLKYFELSGKPIYDKSGEVAYGVFILHDITEERVRTKVIERQNKQLEAIIDNLYDGVAIMDKNGTFIKTNKVLKEFMRSKTVVGEVVDKIGKTASYGQKYYNENGEEITIQDIPSSRVLRGEEVKKQRILINNGLEKIYLDFDGIPIYDNDGSLELGVIIAKDMTEHIKKSKEIEGQNKQLNAIIECIDDIVTILDKDGNYIRRSKMLHNSFGFVDDNLYDIPEKVQFFHLDGSEIQAEELCTARLLKGQKVKDHKIKMIKDGKEIYVSASGIPIFDKNGDIEMGVMITHDITELVQSSILIENQKKELETIIENMHDGLVVIDKNTKVIRCNKAIKEVARKIHSSARIVDYATETLSDGRKYFDEEFRELSFEELPIARILKGETVERQRVMSTKDTRKTYAEFNCTPIFDENGDFKFGILLRHDLTELMEKENKIKEQQELLYKSEKEHSEMLEKALIMKDEFISLITHEFKTPLNVIYSAVQLIEHIYMAQVPERVKSLIGNIKQNTFRQLRLVNNLLDITRLNSGRFKLNVKNIDIVFLTKVITESVKLYADQKKIDLYFKTNVTSKVTALDDEKYERIVLNLLSNAIKFTSENGSITVNVNEDRKHNKVAISVQDTGMGIPKDKQELIFERFGQVESDLSRHAEGTGIGLSLVKLLIDILEGIIQVESELGIGSTFTVILPLKKCIEFEEDDVCLDSDNRLVTAVNVEFSDIYF